MVLFSIGLKLFKKTEGKEFSKVILSLAGQKSIVVSLKVLLLGRYFVIYINVLPDVIHNNSKLYADDTKILSRLDSENSAQLIQHDLNKAYDWTQDWLIKFNIGKYVVMHYDVNNKNWMLFI